MKKLNYLILSVVALSILFSSCARIEGEGPIVQESISVPVFTGVELAGGFDVIVTLGDVQSVVAEGQQNIIDRLRTEVGSDGTLKIELEHGMYRNYDLIVYVTVPTADKFCISGSGDMTIYQSEGLILDNLRLRIAGSGDMKGVGNFLVNDETKATIAGSGDMNFVLETNEPNAEITGSGNMFFDVLANTTEVDITGSGDIEVVGDCPAQDVEITGSGDYHGYSYPANTFDARITGSGNIECQVASELDATITGSGCVLYKGQPVVNVNISGSGSVKHVN